MGLGDFTNILGKVQEMQANMKNMQDELEKQIIEASSGGGMVTVKINGKFEMLDIKIDKNAVDVNDIEMLEDLVKAAFNAAGVKAREEMKNKMANITGGMNLPGMDKISSMLGLG